jgi:ribosomal subunit interface protein
MRGVELMKIIVSAKNIELTSALKNVVEKKLSKLDRYFDPLLEAHATLGVEKNRQIIEVTIPFGGRILRGEEANDDMYASIDLVVDKLEKQIIKQKTKLSRNVHSDSVKFHSIPELEVTEHDRKTDPSIVRTKKFAIKPMCSEEAVLQMELLGHNFFVYEDDKTEEVNVVYKRKDGNYGLIQREYV